MGSPWVAGGGGAPCLVEWFPLEGVQPQMLEQICWASLGRAEISPNLSLGETISCPDLLGTPLPMRPGISAETAWLGQVGEWDLEEKMKFGLLLELLRKSHVVPCGQAVTAAHHPPALFFGEEEREAELLG